MNLQSLVQDDDVISLFFICYMLLRRVWNSHHDIANKKYLAHFFVVHINCIACSSPRSPTSCTRVPQRPFAGYEPNLAKHDVSLIVSDALAGFGRVGRWSDQPLSPQSLANREHPNFRQTKFLNQFEDELEAIKMMCHQHHYVWCQLVRVSTNSRDSNLQPTIVRLVPMDLLALA